MRFSFPTRLGAVSPRTACFLLLTFAACAGEVGDLDDPELVEAGPPGPAAPDASEHDGAVGDADGGTRGDATVQPPRGDGGDGGVPDPGVIAAGVRWVGRVDLSDVTAPRFSWSGTGFVARFRGTGLRVRLRDSDAFRYKAVVDGAPRDIFVASAAEQVLASGLAPGEHTLALYRQSEGTLGDSQLLSIHVDDGALLAPPPPPARLIELIGDSISTGYGNLGTGSGNCFATQSHWDTYGAIAARALGAELSTIAASGHGVYRDYQGNTQGIMQPRYERARANPDAPPWTFAAQPQVVVINLGTNDVGSANSDPGQPYRDGYLRLVRTVRAKYPRARIVGTIGPMLGGAHLAAIRGHIAAAMDTLRAAGDDEVSTFFGIETQTTDKFGCDAHPNLAQNELMGAQLAAELRRLLGW